MYSCLSEACLFNCHKLGPTYTAQASEVLLHNKSSAVQCLLQHGNSQLYRFNPKEVRRLKGQDVCHSEAAEPPQPVPASITESPTTLTSPSVESEARTSVSPQFSQREDAQTLNASFFVMHICALLKLAIAAGFTHPVRWPCCIK
eukprot:s3116_g9.t1